MVRRSVAVAASLVLFFSLASLAQATSIDEATSEAVAVSSLDVSSALVEPTYDVQSYYSFSQFSYYDGLFGGVISGIIHFVSSFDYGDYFGDCWDWVPPPPPGSQVPEPSAALVFGAGTLVFGTTLRRRR